MTRPTDTEIAALLRELADSLHRETVLYEGYIHPLVEEAVAMADQLQPTQEES